MLVLYARCTPSYFDRPLGKYMMFDPTAGLIPPKAACCFPKTEHGNGPQNAFDESRPRRAKSVMAAPGTAPRYQVTAAWELLPANNAGAHPDDAGLPAAVASIAFRA